MSRRWAVARPVRHWITGWIRGLAGRNPAIAAPLRVEVERENRLARESAQARKIA